MTKSTIRRRRDYSPFASTAVCPRVYQPAALPERPHPAQAAGPSRNRSDACARCRRAKKQGLVDTTRSWLVDETGVSSGPDGSAEVNEVIDLFISFAHADNERPQSAAQGWVTTLVSEL